MIKNNLPCRQKLVLAWQILKPIITTPKAFIPSMAILKIHICGAEKVFTRHVDNPNLNPPCLFKKQLHVAIKNSNLPCQFTNTQHANIKIASLPCQNLIYTAFTACLYQKNKSTMSKVQKKKRESNPLLHCCCVLCVCIKINNFSFATINYFLKPNLSINEGEIVLSFLFCFVFSLMGKTE